MLRLGFGHKRPLRLSEQQQSKEYQQQRGISRRREPTEILGQSCAACKLRGLRLHERASVGTRLVLLLHTSMQGQIHREQVRLVLIWERRACSLFRILFLMLIPFFVEAKVYPVGLAYG